MYHNYISNFRNCNIAEASVFGWYYYGILIVLLILLVVFLIVYRKKERKNKNIDLLKSMFIQGKITEEEYLQKKRVLAE